MSFQCYACGYKATRSSGLTNHKKTCRQHLLRSSAATETFLKNVDRNRSEKRGVITTFFPRKRARMEQEQAEPQGVSKLNCLPP